MTDRTGLRAALVGVGVTPVTPFTEDLDSVDEKGLAANLEFLIEHGVRLLYPAGNTGEAASLGVDEWEAVLRVAVEVAGDRARVVPGVGHELPVALEMARRAADLGADGLLLMPRQQPYAAGRGMVEYWRRIITETDLPVVLYKRGLPEDAHLVGTVDHPSVVGCKYGGKDVSAFASVVDADLGTTVWTCGVAERYAPFFFAAGARGFTSGLANFAPRLALRMDAALQGGDLETALALRRTALPFEELRARHGDAYNVAAVKAAMEEAGLAGGAVRPPLVGLDPHARSEIPAMVEAMTR